MFKLFKKRRRGYLSPRQREKRRRRRTAVSVIVPILLIGVLIGGSYLTKLDSITVKEVTVEGAETVDAAPIRQIVREEIEGAYLGLFAQANAFLYPRGAIRERVLRTDTRIKTAEVALKDLREIRVSIEEYRPHAVWCRLSNPDALSGYTNNCFFMDETGYIFADAPDFSDDVYVRFYGDEKPDSKPVSKRFLSEKRFQSIDALRMGLEKIGLEPLRVVAMESGDFETHLKSGAVVISDSDPGPRTALMNLENVFAEEEPFGGMTPADAMQKIGRVDLRFERRVYYTER